MSQTQETVTKAIYGIDQESIQEKVTKDLTDFFGKKNDEIDKLFARYSKREILIIAENLGLKRVSFSEKWSDMELGLLKKAFSENDQLAQLKLNVLGRNDGVIRRQAELLGLKEIYQVSGNRRSHVWSFYELQVLRDNIEKYPNGRIPELNSLGRSAVACRKKAISEGYLA